MENMQTCELSGYGVCRCALHNNIVIKSFKTRSKHWWEVESCGSKDWVLTTDNLARAYVALHNVAAIFVFYFFDSLF